MHNKYIVLLQLNSQYEKNSDFHQSEARQIPSRTQTPQNYRNVCRQKISLTKSYNHSE